MGNDETGRQLHDRATRGEALSGEERARLDEWYAQQDQEERAQLEPGNEASSIGGLQSQVDNAVAKLSAVTERIQAISAENEVVRREIATLERQLAQKVAT